MPIGLASTHAPTMFNAPERWDLASRIIGRTGEPLPKEHALETREVLEVWAARRDAHFATLRARIEEYRPDLMIFLGGDQGETFDASNVPQLMIYLGEEAYGCSRMFEAPTPETEVRWRVDVETSRWLLEKLVRDCDFDVAFSTEQRSIGPRAQGNERMMPHAFSLVAKWLTPRMDVPSVLIWENTYDPPSISARRCYDFGQALAHVFRDDPRRVVIYGSGGLSHDLSGRRLGWVDTPLDRWFLKCMSEGNGKETLGLYTFDSDTMRSGTGEIRAWITVAGAMEAAGARATVLDYIPASTTLTGLSWAYWKVGSPEH